MKIFIEKENKHIELKAKDGFDLLKQLNINESEVLIIKNNKVVLTEDTLEESDEIKLLSVISGG